MMESDEPIKQPLKEPTDKEKEEAQNMWRNLRKDMVKDKALINHELISVNQALMVLGGIEDKDEPFMVYQKKLASQISELIDMRARLRDIVPFKRTEDAINDFCKEHPDFSGSVEDLEKALKIRRKELEEEAEKYKTIEKEEQQ